MMASSIALFVCGWKCTSMLLSRNYLACNYIFLVLSGTWSRDSSPSISAFIWGLYLNFYLEVQMCALCSCVDIRLAQGVATLLWVVYLLLVLFSSLTLLANQIYAQIEEDKDLSVVTSVELKKLFPGKKVNEDRFHKKMETFWLKCTFWFPIFTYNWF